MEEKVVRILLLTAVAGFIVSSAPVAAACNDSPFPAKYNCFEERGLEYGDQLESLCAPPPPRQYSSGVARLPHFTAEPVDHTQTNITLLRETVILLECNYTIADDSTHNGTISWEHNGLVFVNGSRLEVSFPSLYSSQLRIYLPLTEETSGKYRCIVNSATNYTVASRTAEVTPSYTSGWLDQVYTQSHLEESGDSVQLHSPVGGSVILECQLNTTEEVTTSRLWLHRGAGGFVKVTPDSLHAVLPDGSLLVRNFNLLAGSSAEEYKCGVPFLNGEKKWREFTILKGPANPVLPRDSTVAVGGNLNLYCLINSPSSLGDITWYKDDQPLVPAVTKELGVDWTHYQPMGEVLVLGNITMEMGGVYTCVSDDKAHFALLTVIGPPDSADITIAGEGSYGQNDTLYIPVELNHPINTSLTLHCTSTSNSDPLEYQWLFRGSSVDSFGDLFAVKDGVLTIVASDLWNVIGSYQCSVTNIAGSVSTSVKLLPGDTGDFMKKPAPPSNIEVVQVISEGFPFKYHLQWDSLQPTGKDIVYKVVIDVFRLGVSHNRYTCHVTYKEYPYLLFWGNRYMYDSYRLIFRVAASSSDGVWSELAPFNSCPKPFIVERVPPPSPRTLSSSFTTLADQKAHGFNTTLRWFFPECWYPQDMLEVTVELNCSRMEPWVFDNTPPAFVGEYNVEHVIPCCTDCSWAVVLQYGPDSSLHLNSRAEHNFTTPTLRPSSPAVLNAVGRPSESNGQEVTIDFTLPPVNESCKPSEVIVQYNNETVTKGLSSATPVEEVYSVTADLEAGVCWEELDISVAYSNTEGQSEFSNVLRLEGPSTDSVNGFSNFSVEAATPTEVEAEWGFDAGMHCLLSRSLAQGTVCFTTLITGQVCPSVISENCQAISPEATRLSFTSGIRPYTEYCFVALLILNNDSTTATNHTAKTLASMKASVRSQESSPNGRPTDFNLSVLQEPSSSLHINWGPPLQIHCNGVLTHYNLSVSKGQGVAANVSAVRAGQEQYEEEIEYDPSVNYQVSVSACTSVGCGPTATQTILANGTPHGTQPSPNKDTLIGAITGGLLAVAVLVVTVVMILVTLCVYRRIRANRKQDEYHRRLPAWLNESENGEPSIDPPIDFPYHNSARSIESDYTVISPLIHRHNKDLNNYIAHRNPEDCTDEHFDEEGLPEIEVHNQEFEEDEELPDSASSNWSGVARLNSSPGGVARRNPTAREVPLNREAPLELGRVCNGYVIQHGNQQSRTQFEKCSTNGEELSVSLRSTTQLTAAQLPTVQQVTGYVSNTGEAQLTSAAVETGSQVSFDIFEDNFVSNSDLDSPAVTKNAVTAPSNGYCTEQQAATFIPLASAKLAAPPALSPPPPSRSSLSMRTPPLSGYCTESDLSSMTVAPATLPSTVCANSPQAVLPYVDSASFTFGTPTPTTGASNTTSKATASCAASNGRVTSEASANVNARKPPVSTGYVTIGSANSGPFNAKLAATTAKESTPEFDLGQLIEDCSSDLSDSDSSSVFADPPPQQTTTLYDHSASHATIPLHLASERLHSIPDSLNRTRSTMSSGVYSASSDASSTPAASRPNSAMSYDHCSSGSSRSSSGLGYHHTSNLHSFVSFPAAARNGSEGYQSVGGASDVASQDNSRSVCSRSLRSPKHAPSSRTDGGVNGRRSIECDGGDIISDDADFNYCTSASDLAQDILSTSKSLSPCNPQPAIQSTSESVPPNYPTYSCIPSLLPHNNQLLANAMKEISFDFPESEMQPAYEDDRYPPVVFELPSIAASTS